MAPAGRVRLYLKTEADVEHVRRALQEQAIAVGTDLVSNGGLLGTFLAHKHVEFRSFFVRPLVFRLAGLSSFDSKIHGPACFCWPSLFTCSLVDCNNTDFDSTSTNAPGSRRR